MYVEIYYANVTCLKDEDIFRRLYEKMPDDRRAAADRLRFDADRRLSVGAFSLLRYALMKKGLTEVFPISSGEHGKPYFPDRRDLHFNLSHSGDVALCALSDRDIGCDAEKIRKPPFRVAEKFFSEEERKYVFSGGTEKERTNRFFKVWTLKESALKATGSGFTYPASSSSVVDASGKETALTVSGDVFTPRAVTVARGYASAFCVKGETADPAIENVDLKALDC